VVLAPCTTVWEAGVAERLKLGAGAALTTRVTEVVCARVPLTLVIVTAKLPTGVVAASVLTVMVEELLAGFGLKLAVAAVDNPLALKVTSPVKPPDGEMLRL